MRAVLYCRVSSATQDQDHRGSIRTQQEFAERYCKTNDIELIASYLDDGISGSIPIKDRPAGSRLLNDARVGHFDTLLIYNLSRLSRDTLDALETIRTLHGLGIALKSISDGVVVDSSPMGQFVITQLAGLNQLVRDNIRTDSRRGMERCAREGKWVGGKAPFGYRVVDRRLTIDPEQASIVKDIFNWYLSGLRVRGIAARLNAQGVKHPLDWNKPRSRPWYEATVSHLLNNRVYIGEWAWRKRTNVKKVQGKQKRIKTSEDQHITFQIPAIISETDFGRTKETLRANFSNSLRNAKHFYLLRGLLFCRHCKYRYIGVASGRKPWIKNYYRCGSHVGYLNRQPCAGKAVRADVIERAIWRDCVNFATDPSLVIDELRRTMALRQGDQSDLRHDIDRLAAAISNKLGERAKVINLNRRGVISDTEAENELNMLKAELAELDRQHAELLFSVQASEAAELRILTAETMLNFLAEKVLSADDQTKREIVLAWVDRIEIETVGEGKTARAVANVRYVFRPSPQPSTEAVDCVEPALAISSARFAESWPRTSLKSTL